MFTHFIPGPEFAEVFVIVWIGAMVVTFNSKLLGGNMYDYLNNLISISFENNFYILAFRSFFQSVCVLGYCLTPIAIALIVCRMILLGTQTRFLFFLRLLSTSVGFIWATYGTLNNLFEIIFSFKQSFSFQHLLSSLVIVNQKIENHWLCTQYSYFTSYYLG